MDGLVSQCGMLNNLERGLYYLTNVRVRVPYSKTIWKNTKMFAKAYLRQLKTTPPTQPL